MNRIDIINRLIKSRRYTEYLEIGVANGMCFNKIHAQIKIGVDPAAESACTHCMTSDEYFSRYADKHRHDLIFIDGLHEYPQVFKDIHNSMKALKEAGIIVLHDCNPTTSHLASEHCVPGAWNGTVWKAVLHCRMLGLAKIEVVNTDCGCGILTPGLTEPLNLGVKVADIATLPYKFLQQHRQAILNLIGDFKTRYLGEMSPRLYI